MPIVKEVVKESLDMTKPARRASTTGDPKKRKVNEWSHVVSIP